MGQMPKKTSKGKWFTIIRDSSGRKVWIHTKSEAAGVIGLCYDGLKYFSGIELKPGENIDARLEIRRRR